MDLPVSTMTGTAKVNLKWNMDAQQLVAANGTLQMTPIAVKLYREPECGARLGWSVYGLCTTGQRQTDFPESNALGADFR